MKFFLQCLQLLPLLIIFTLESLLKLFIPKKRKSVTGEIVLITGAGHGIGRLTAYEFAKLNSKLVLWDINKRGIEDTAAECRRLGAKAYAFVVDCSNRENIYSSAKKVKEEIGDVSILVNNAGVVYTSDLFATQDTQIEKTFEVNVLAHFWTTKAFLPVMMENNHGHIVTLASAAGHTGVPFLLAYCSSKFAAVGFHKALTEELAALERTGIKTTCVCPNFINTGFIKNPSTALGPTLEPEEVVNKLMNGILTEQKMIFIPSSISVLTVVEKILPERFLVFLKRKINVNFDAVIGYKTKEQ
ncbi:estradiol 17-beta-dehydrogenase 11 [Halichoerus grypus]|uniref:estradiol 17-beta-dehydrogenase 11 n=1 Tax=Phoca vitulina TaxID=9720 RepID=UPI00139635C5|nr:estradiol 17-beta-dehydrogenase 11 [Phoca vitulina]XP_032256651.1 estradiol 17-beta-dehydrogenase 11 [Phoca vitulina]XP_035952634.1 estradiol 17-beta-dehydrogenase 11-like isoform X1 [Halichoerus grypus]